MKACLLHSPARVETNPLVFTDLPDPVPQGDQVLVRVNACGVCRTDLHVVEGELPPRKSPVVPGHQVVGRIEKAGEAAKRFRIGDRVGIPWLHRTDGVCDYCRAGKENLCDNPTFTGYMVDGGYAEYTLAPEGVLCHRIPEGLTDQHAAPLYAQASSVFAPCAFQVLKRVESWDCTVLGRRRTWRSRWRAIGTFQCTL